MQTSEITSAHACRVGCTIHMSFDYHIFNTAYFLNVWTLVGIARQTKRHLTHDSLTRQRWSWRRRKNCLTWNVRGHYHGLNSRYTDSMYGYTTNARIGLCGVVRNAWVGRPRVVITSSNRCLPNPSLFLTRVRNDYCTDFVNWVGLYSYVSAA